MQRNRGRGRKRGKGGGKEGHFAKTLKGKLESLEKMRDWGEDGNPSW